MADGGWDRRPDLATRVTRRSLLAGALAGAVAARGLPSLSARAASTSTRRWYLPADTVEHERTWMAWPARRDVWGSQLEAVRADIARIARTVARYEPVSLVARPSQAAAAAAACGPGVTVVPIQNDDLWIRDMGPIFLVDGHGGLAGLDLNFNGWGGRQVHSSDAKVAALVLAGLGVPRIVAPFVSEGGALEVDGEGTVVATESSIVNPNRNPGRSREALTAEILAALGASRMLWVPGLRNHDITDDHIDGLARFVGAGRMVVDQPAEPLASGPWARSDRRALAILRRSGDAGGRPLRCLISRESRRIPPGQDPNTFVNVYVNWYVCNGAVLIPAFGDRAADRAAAALVAGLFPGRTVEQLRIDTLASGGGGIHCATQQQPRVG